MPGFRHSVLLSLVLDPRPQPLACQGLGGSQALLANGAPDGSSVFRPQQSWQLSGGQGMGYSEMAMLVQRLPGVVRRGLACFIAQL